MKYFLFILFPIIITAQDITGVVIGNCQARKIPDLFKKEVVFELQKNERIYVDSIVNNEWYMITKNDTAGFVLKHNIKLDTNSQKFLEQQRRELRKKVDEDRNKYCIKTYGKKWGQIVYERQIQIGMTKEMVIDSWGKPRDINRTVGEWGVHEQWVYSSDTYLYFENGKLTSWQD